MSEMNATTMRMPINPEFFCDGKFYVLTSFSLGGSSFTTSEIAEILGDGIESSIKELLQQGVCLPLYFEPDCELDRVTQFVIGDMTEEENNQWIGRIIGKLNIPCGKFVLLCGGGDQEAFAYAISGKPPAEHFEYFQVIDVPPGEYQVEIYAYLSSFIAQDYLENQKTSVQQWFQEHFFESEDLGYIIHLTPLVSIPPLPRQIEEIGWCGEFEFRQPK